VTSVLGVGIGAPAVQNDSVVAVVVICIINIGKTKTIINRTKTAAILNSTVKVRINNVNHRKCCSSN
jgi:hypothetical protein